MSTPPDTPTTPDPDLLAALSAATAPLEQKRIAIERPDLHAALASNPGVYPELLEWLRGLQDPAVQAALAQRDALHADSAPAPEEPGVRTPPADNRQAAAAADDPQDAADAALAAESSAPAARGRKHSPLSVGLAVVVVLAVVGAGFGLHALLSQDSTSSSPAPTVADVPTVAENPSATEDLTPWAEGSHQVWTLDVDKNAEIAAHDSQMLVGDRSSSYTLTRVTAYDVSGTEPRKQWETAVDQAFGRLAYWGEWVTIGGNQLLRASDGTLTTAGWDASVTPYLVDTFAMTCDKNDRCAGWSASDPTKPLWEQEIDDSYEWLRHTSYVNLITAHDGAPVFLASPETAVRLGDGSLIDFDIDEDRQNVLPLKDGWRIYDLVDNRYTVLTTSGKQTDSFEGQQPSSEQRHVPLFESPLMTAAQLRMLVADNDVSWAPVTVAQEPGGTSGCATTLTVGEHSVVPAQADGACVDEYEEGWYSLSSDKAVLMYVVGNPTTQFGSSVQLVGMWSVADGKPVSFEGSTPGEQPMWLVSPELVIALDDTEGGLTAYAPGKG